MELNFKKTSLIFIGAESGKTGGKNKQQLSFASEFPAQCRDGDVSILQNIDFLPSDWWQSARNLSTPTRAFPLIYNK